MSEISCPGHVKGERASQNPIVIAIEILNVNEEAVCPILAQLAVGHQNRLP